MFLEAPREWDVPGVSLHSLNCNFFVEAYDASQKSPQRDHTQTHNRCLTGGEHQAREQRLSLMASAPQLFGLTSLSGKRLI